MWCPQTFAARVNRGYNSRHLASQLSWVPVEEPTKGFWQVGFHVERNVERNGTRAHGFFRVSWWDMGLNWAEPSKLGFQNH